MNWLWLTFSKLIILSIFLASNAFAGGLEVSRQNNMILFSKDILVSKADRIPSLCVISAPDNFN